MVSEPLLWPFLSSLVFIGVTPFSTSLSPSQQLSQPLAVEPSIPAIILGFWTCNRHRWGVSHYKDHCPLHHRCKYCSDYVSEGTTEIVLRWSTHSGKPQSHQRPHAPPCRSKVLFRSSHASTRRCTSGLFLHALHLQVTRLHTPSHASTLLLTSFCHVSPSCVIVEVTWLRQPQTSSFYFWMFDCWLLSRFNRWLSKGWPLTFSQSWLFAVQCSLPSFSHRFHFYSPFLHILLLNEK